MIQGLYEAHLPVKNLENSIKFYEKIGLNLAWRDSNTAFFWLEEGKSWLGLWEGKEHLTPYHPSLRHIAFRVSFENIEKSIQWLNERGIAAVPFGGRNTTDPFVRANQGNASVYFEDPDGNSLEFMCHVNVPEKYQFISNKLSINEWKELIQREQKHSETVS